MTSTTSHSVLAQPLTLPCGLTLPNRIMKAAMGEGLADVLTSDPTPAMLRLYSRWAAGGAGTLVSGVCNVQRGTNESTFTVVDEHTDITALVRWAGVVHEHDVRILPQLMHAGRQTPVYVARHPGAPSNLPPVRDSHLFGTARALTGDEVRHLVERFATAAGILEKAGFDGVEIHAAHGYLVGQFLSSETNRRDDEWGGDLERRSRFLLEIVRQIRDRVDPGFAVAVKLNASDFRPGGFDIDDSAHVAGRLGAEGVDLIEISGGTYESESGCLQVRPDEPGTSPQAYFAGFAPRLREMTDVPLALTGGLRSREVMEKLLEDRVVDVIGLARPLVQQPDFPAELLAGRADRIALTDPPDAGGMYELFWYIAQFERLANGQAYDPSYSLRRLQARMLTGMAAQFVVAGRRQLGGALRHAADLTQGRVHADV